jgi:transposase
MASVQSSSWLWDLSPPQAEAAQVDGRALISTRSGLCGLPPRAGQTGDDADILYALRTVARRYRDLAVEIDALEDRMLARATTANPSLMAIKGVGPVVGTQLLITAGDNPDRLRSQASLAALCGTAPSPSVLAARTATEAMNLLIKKIKRTRATASATSITTGSGCCCTAASTGILHPQHESEAGYHG